ncbi:uncharacterized protein LOC117541249 [Xyrichtys novacula]|uniref:Uncharacterized protein LOC117541249 n=1 Tax=Xyrichtys novacula TaxID=13765 RepID=A0AAV1EXL2_XYRNO|nr:uncharacterized protein LOC117541249 [Xyrichtys novacula]
MRERGRIRLWQRRLSITLLERWTVPDRVVGGFGDCVIGTDGTQKKKKKSLEENAAPSHKISDLFAQRSASTSGLVRSSSSSRSELTKPPAPESSSFRNDDESSDTTEHGAAEPGQETTDVTMSKDDRDVDRGDRPESSVTIMQKADKPVVRRAFFHKDGTNRKWLSYNEDTEALFCFLCMACANPRDSSSFITGITNFTHIHLRVDEHDQSETHRKCAEAYFLRSSIKTI